MEHSLLATIFSKQNTPSSAMEEVRDELVRVEEELRMSLQLKGEVLPQLNDATPYLETVIDVVRTTVVNSENRRALLAPLKEILRLLRKNIIVSLIGLALIGWGNSLFLDMIERYALHNAFSYTLPIGVTAWLALIFYRYWRERDLTLSERYEKLEPIFFRELNTSDEFPYKFDSQWQERTFSQTWRFGDSFEIMPLSIAFDIKRKGESIGLIFRDTNSRSKFRVFMANDNTQFTVRLPGSVSQFFQKCREQVERFKSIRKELSPLEISRDQLRLIQSVALDQETLFELLSAVTSFAQMGSKAARGILLLGPPGTGKSYIAKVISEVAGIAFYDHTLSSLKSANVGGSGQNVRELWNTARQNQPSVVFIDECDSIFSKRGGNDEDAFTNEIVNAFLPEWDGMNSNQSVLVIGATNRPNSLDSAIVSRFTYQFNISLPSGESRFKIFMQETSKRDIHILNPDTAIISEATSGMSGREIVNMTQKLLHKSDVNNQLDCIEAADFIRESNRTSRSSNDNATWSRLILSPDTKENLVNVSKLMDNYEHLIEKFGETNIPKGILLYGPPGTGKTQIARTLANESKVNFIARSGADIRGKYVGHSANNVKQLFAEARSKAPCIIFVDEIDMLASRDESSSTIDKETLGEFLTQMDGFASASDKVLVIAATNVKNSIDTALLSRFPKQIEIPLPATDERAQLYCTFLADLGPFLEPEIDLLKLSREIAAKTEGYSGRKIAQDVKNLTNEIQLQYINTGHDPVLTKTDLLVLADQQHSKG